MVQKDSHLLELARYIVHNPVRAGMVESPGDWRWSSYQATLGYRPHGDWFDSMWLVEQFGASSINALDSYRRFVAEGYLAHSPLKKVKHRLLLGDDKFVAERRTQAQAATAARHAPRLQRRAAALTLTDYQSKFPSRDAAMAEAYKSTAFTMAEIGAHFGVSSKTVGRAVNKFRPARNASVSAPTK